MALANSLEEQNSQYYLPHSDNMKLKCKALDSALRNDTIMPAVQVSIHLISKHDPSGQEGQNESLLCNIPPEFFLRP